MEGGRGGGRKMGENGGGMGEEWRKMGTGTGKWR